MREKELRIALVCFGGVSLAVYMHGITKEILKLVRASTVLHGIDRGKRASATFSEFREPENPEYDTEPLYFELLREIGRTMDLRVIVDILAGASAGGINAVMLARALAHDLPMRKLRDLWLENADISELLASEARAHRWSKWFLRPFFWSDWFGRLKLIRDVELRSKLSLFMRSRWFEPPLDGMKMTALMYDAVMAMGEPPQAASSLLPTGRGLDLFVTLTDFHGRQQLIQIHDPAIVHEREYRHVLHFRYRRRPSGAIESDLEEDNIPALAFAARATSSIPGFFPPAQVLEMDRLLRERASVWPRRADFLASNFKDYADANVDAASVPFIDGSVLNSRPFREAIAAIRGRPAYRDIDRRVIYVDPDPVPAGTLAHHSVPGFFQVLKGALSDIPLAEPVTDELGWVGRYNERVRRLRAVIEGARPQITSVVADIMSSGDQQLDADRIRHWREQANIKAIREASFAYEAYVRLKLASARAFISETITRIRGIRPDSPFARTIAEIIDAWAAHASVAYEPSNNQSLAMEATSGSGDRAKWIKFLLSFDIDYRKRRLRFLIEGQNRLYQLLGSPDMQGLNPSAINRLKRSFYQCIEELEQVEIRLSLDQTTCNLVEDIFRVAPSPTEFRNLQNYAELFAKNHREQLDRLIDRLAINIDLDAGTRRIDGLLADAEGWPVRGIREVLVNYLGFPFWDVVTFPILPWRESGEFNEIRVDRISAQDATAVGQLGTFPLKGVALNKFAAFLSRSYRENDYLLGRLHAIDRLIDIVSDAGGADLLTSDFLTTLKRKAFVTVLKAEESDLPTCNKLIEELRTALNRGHLRDRASD